MAASPAFASTYDSFQLANSLSSATNDPPIIVNLTSQGAGDFHFFLNLRTSTFLSIDPDADCSATCVDPSTNKISYNDSNNFLAQWLIGDSVMYFFSGGSSIGGLTAGAPYYVAGLHSAAMPAAPALTSISPVPVPAAIWFFGTALLGLAGFGRRRRTA